MKLKRIPALLTALALIFSLTVNAGAAAAITVTVKLCPGVAIALNGKPQAMTDANGGPVYPVLYSGTTYLPVRAVSNMLGVDVDWDQSARTVLLTDPKDGGSASASAGYTPPADTSPKDITAQIDPGITIEYNDEAQTMTDANGTPVYPMLYGGTTYLPVRAVSNMLGISVDWDGTAQTVVLDSTGGGAGSNTAPKPDGSQPSQTGQGAQLLAPYAGDYIAYSIGGSFSPMSMDANGVFTGEDIASTGVMPSSVTREEDGSIQIMLAENEYFTIYPAGVVPSSAPPGLLDTSTVNILYVLTGGGAFVVWYHK